MFQNHGIGGKIIEKTAQIVKSRRFCVAEMEGFEPPHAFRRLSDFESEPFSHLGTSPFQLAVQFGTLCIIAVYWKKATPFIVQSYAVL